MTLPSTTVMPATDATPLPATVAISPVIRPTQSPFPAGIVTNGGNLRTEPRLAADTVIGQVCPGDVLFILEQQSAQHWYHVRITTPAANCHPQRVAAETEGWLSSTLIRLQEP